MTVFYLNILSAAICAFVRLRVTLGFSKFTAEPLVAAHIKNVLVRINLRFLAKVYLLETAVD